MVENNAEREWGEQGRRFRAVRKIVTKKDRNKDEKR